ncbi:MAG: fibronectin type III domain-containing protein [Vicinamibacterales bacterium]
MLVSRRFTIIAVAAFAFACGRKGPPLAPLHLVPTAPANILVARVGSDAQLRFDVPATNLNGPGTVAIDHIEVFAATVAAGAIRPANRELLTPKHRIGTIAIKPPPVEGEAPPDESTSDTRPSPGQRTTFVETLTEKTMEPVFTTPAPKPAAPAGAAATATSSAASAASSRTAGQPGGIPPVPELPPVIQPVEALPEAAGAIAPVPSLPEPVALANSALPGESTSAPTGTTPYPARLYTVRGVTKSGRPGPPSTRVELPLLDPPAQPPAPQAVATETAIILTWPTPATGPGPIAYNIYKGGSLDPINAAPVVEGKYERGGVTFGTEECFTLRAVQKVGAVSLESGPSEPVCLTPRDTFPPAAPKGLSIVAGTGTMNLGWDANTEPDLAGYLILRGEAPGDTLQPLTPAPITATSYEDKAVKPGVRYIYSIVAVDKASPPNRSAPSARVEETAR